MASSYMSVSPAATLPFLPPPLSSAPFVSLLADIEARSKEPLRSSSSSFDSSSVAGGVTAGTEGDYAAYFVPASARGMSGAIPLLRRPTNAAVSSFSSAAYRFTKRRIVAQSSIFPSTAGATSVSAVLGGGASSSVSTETFELPAPQRAPSRRPVEGHAVVFVHAPDSVIRADLLDESSPLFLFAPLAVNGCKSDRAADKETRQRNPRVLSKTADEMAVHVQRKLRNHPYEVVAELLLRVTTISAAVPNTSSFISFETIDDSSLPSDALRRLNERPAAAADAAGTSPPSPTSSQSKRQAKMLSGEERCYLVLSPHSHLPCTFVKMVFRGSYAVDLTDAGRRLLLERCFAPLSLLQQRYAAAATIDELERRHFVAAMGGLPALTHDEAARLTRNLEEYCNVEDGLYKRIRGSLRTFPTVQMFTKTDKTDGLHWGKCYGFVDEAPEIVLAWYWLVCSYERTAKHRESNGDLVRVTDASDERRSQIVKLEVKMAPGVRNRSGVHRYTWFKVGDRSNFAIAFEPVVAEAGGPEFTANSVMATTFGMFLFEEVAPRITRVTHIQKSDLKGVIPKMLMKSLVVWALNITLSAQEKFRRADRIVDKEVRESIASRVVVALPGISTDLHILFDSCSHLKSDFEAKSNQGRIKDVTSHSPFVQLTVRPAMRGDHSNPGRLVATGRSVTEVDTSTEEVVAWVFDYCSRDRMRINCEKGNLPRLVHSSNSDNDTTVVSHKPAPFPMSTREFVSRIVWMKPKEEMVVVCVQSVADVVDYGASPSEKRGLVRATTTAYWCFDRVGSFVSKVTLFQKVDFAGIVPVFIVNLRIPNALSVVDDARRLFQRDEEVDTANRKCLTEELMRRDLSEIDANTQELLEAVKRTLAKKSTGEITGAANLATKRAVECASDHSLKISRIISRAVSASDRHHPSSNQRAASFRLGGFFEADVVIDAALCECVAWCLLKASRQRSQTRYDVDSCSFTRETVINGYRRETVETFTKEKKRIVTESVWSRRKDEQENEGVSYVVAEQQRVGDLEGSNDTSLPSTFFLRRKGSEHYLRTNTASKMSATTFVDIESLANGAIPQTDIVMSFVLGEGHRSKLLSDDVQALFATRYLSEMRKYFDKSVEIDRRARDAYSLVIQTNEDAYDADEVAVVDLSISILERYEKEKKTRRIKSESSLTESNISRSTDSVWGRAVASVRAPSADVLAFFMLTKARNQIKPDTLEKTYLEEPNEHNRLEYIIKRSPKPFANREFCNRLIWKWIDDSTLIFSSFPEFHARCGKDASLVLGSSTGVIRLRASNSDETDVEFVLNLLFGGAPLPLFVQEYYCGYNLRRITIAQQYFQCLRCLSEYDEKDGAAVGETFMIKTEREEKKTKRKNKSKYQIRVASIVSKHVALKEFTADNPWFPSLVEGMLSNWLVDSTDIKAKLENLSNKEALTIGRTLSMAVYYRQEAVSAADMFVHEYASLVELKRRHRFFVPMVTAIGQRKLHQAPWGKFFIVGIGAVLGVLDVATDVYAISNFMLQGRYGYAKAVIAMITFSMACQVIIVCLSGRERGIRHVAKESMIAVSGLKPAVAAFRVISGARADVKDLLDPTFELILSKITEVVAESIPSALVQIYATLESKEEVRFSSLLSVVVSIATISLASTTICFDLDLDPEKRAHTPDFYGFVPNNSGKRSTVFVSMVIFTMCHVAARLLGIALLAVVSPMITALVLGGDMAFFLLFKLARNDLRYWLNLEGVLSWVATIIVRFFTKLMVDFSVMTHMRHPVEIGGLYWVFSVVIGQATSFVALHLYSGLGAVGGAVTSHDLLALLISVEVGFIVFFAVFLLMMAAKYRATFLSSETGKQLTHRKFRTATNVKAKVDVFSDHPSYYAGIRDEVKTWVLDNYSTWIEDRPEWFTERLKHRIPKDMIPVQSNEGGDGDGDVQKRDKSIRKSSAREKPREREETM